MNKHKYQLPLHSILVCIVCTFIRWWHRKVNAHSPKDIEKSEQEQSSTRCSPFSSDTIVLKHQEAMIIRQKKNQQQNQTKQVDFPVDNSGPTRKMNEWMNDWTILGFWWRSDWLTLWREEGWFRRWRVEGDCRRKQRRRWRWSERGRVSLRTLCRDDGWGTRDPPNRVSIGIPKPPWIRIFLFPNPSIDRSIEWDYDSSTSQLQLHLHQFIFFWNQLFLWIVQWKDLEGKEGEYNTSDSIE